MIRRLLSFTALFFLGGSSLNLLGQDKTPPKSLEYLLDGVTKLYVVDESRCSAQPNSPDAGKWYVIEGEPVLRKLRGEFRKVPANEGAACACGGADIHFYSQNNKGEIRYFGLDCESDLDGHDIPKALQLQIIPAKKSFVGKCMGPTYIVDVPLEIPETAIRAKFAKADLNLLVGGWWNMFSGCVPREFALHRHVTKTAPVYLELKIGPIRAPKSVKGDFQDGERAMKAEAAAMVRKWLDGAGLASHLMIPEQVEDSESTSVEASFSADCYLRDANAVRMILAKEKKRKIPGLRISEITFRTQKEMGTVDFYQAALLLPEVGVSEGIRRAKALLPAGCKVTCLCERGPKEN